MFTLIVIVLASLKEIQLLRFIFMALKFIIVISDLVKR